MNFFGHAAVAAWRSRDPGFVLGAMLPDFAAMIRARPPSPRHPALRAGVGFHHVTDVVFHEAPTFLSLSRRALADLLARGMRRGSARAVAHVGVEILLDASLARDERARAAYVAALDVSRPEQLGSELGWPTPALRARFEALRTTLESRGVAADDHSPELVAYRLERALAGRPRLALDERGQRLACDWAARARAEVERDSARLIGEVSAALEGACP